MRFAASGRFMLVLVSPPAAAAQPSPLKPYVEPAAALARTQLGVRLAAWRATPPGAAASCAAETDGSQTCRIPAAQLGGGYQARDLSYVFHDGRLTRIAFDASIDALPFATAAMKAEFGAPSETTRDTLRMRDGSSVDHVAYRWAAAGATAELSDPPRAADRLEVVMHLGAGATAQGS